MGSLIVLGVLGLGLLTVSVFSEGTNIKTGAFIWGILITALLVTGLIASSWNGFYSDGQKDALKGVQNYEKQVVYRLNDTIPVDTLYVKIK